MSRGVASSPFERGKRDAITENAEAGWG